MSRVILASGGSFQGIITNTSILPSEAIIYVDVRKEVQKTITLNHNPATPLILGDGQTVPTLIKEVASFPHTQEIMTWFENLPAINLEQGMGMWPILGRIAIEMTITGTGNSTETLSHFAVTKIFDPIFQKAQGVLPTIELLSCNSLSGGVSGGVGHILLKETLNAINARVKAAITNHALRIGGVTYNGLGDNAWPNAGMRLCETLTYILTPDRLDQELRTLTLVEIPVVGRNKELRDQLTTQFMQALFCTKVQNDLSIGLPNISKRLDAIKTITVNFWNGISPRIASANNYVNETRYLINSVQPDPYVCEEIRVNIVKQGSALNVPGIQKIINDQRRAPNIAELEGNLVYPAVIFVITNQKDATRLTEHELNKPARTPDTISEFQLKASKYSGLAQRLKAEHDKINTEYIAATTKINETLSKIGKVINETDSETDSTSPTNAKKQSWWSKIFGSNEQEKQKSQNRSNLLPQCLTQAEEYYRLKAYVEVLESGLRTIQGQLDLYQERLRRLEKNLQIIIGGNDTRASAYVDFKTFGELFGQLIPLSEAGQTDTMAIVLDNSVKNVTPVGLAIIAGLEPEETDPIAIVNALLNSTPAYVGPDWGGKEDTKNPIIRFLVFPPMGDELALEIKAAMVKLDEHCHFATSDCNAGGLNVVELTFYQPEWITDIVTPLYWKGLKDAMGKPYLYCLPDIDTAPMVDELKAIYEKEFKPTIISTGVTTETTIETKKEFTT
ncbi:MAG: hypothetical protein AUJ33_00715 [Parcubacteria group bacterium CG1_02_40_25]|nr:MAG: hypothetical protein AUJ33_00715 [Parcubacteria group bacterium CG1_02_40_25]